MTRNGLLLVVYPFRDLRLGPRMSSAYGISAFA